MIPEQQILAYLEAQEKAARVRGIELGIQRLCCVDGNLGFFAQAKRGDSNRMGFGRTVEAAVKELKLRLAPTDAEIASLRRKAAELALEADKLEAEATK